MTWQPPTRGLKIAQLLLAIVTAGAVLDFGGVEPAAFTRTAFGVSAVALYVFWRSGRPQLPLSTAMVLLVLVAIPWIQLLPLPAGAIAWFSPARVAAHQELLGAWGLATPYLSLSFQRFATFQAALLLICYVLVFVVAFHLYRRHVPPALPTLLVVLGVFEAAYGLLQYLTGWQYIFAFQKRFYTEEATGTYINRNHFAGLLEMVLPFLLANVLFGRSSRGPEKWASRFAESSFHTLRNVTLFAIVFLGLFFSRSRMGIVAASAAVILVSVLALRQRERRSWAAVLMILAIPLGYAVWVGVTPITERFEEGALEHDRLPLWRDAWTQVRDYPWVGAGLGTYYWMSPHYQTNNFQWRVDHAHNDYLELAAGIGIPAALLLFGSLAVLAVRAGRKALVLEHRSERVLAAGCAGSLASLLIHSLTDFNLQMPANALIFSWIAGTALAVTRPPTEDVC